MASWPGGPIVVRWHCASLAGAASPWRLLPSIGIGFIELKAKPTKALKGISGVPAMVPSASAIPHAVCWTLEQVEPRMRSWGAAHEGDAGAGPRRSSLLAASLSKN